MGLMDNIVDKALNAVTGSNIKTIDVSADELARIINEKFIMPAGSYEARREIEKVVKSGYFMRKEIESPDGNYRLWVSAFERGITSHRTAWVKDYATERVYQWEGYSLGPLKRAVQFYLNQADLSPSYVSQSPISQTGIAIQNEHKSGSQVRYFCTQCGTANFMDEGAVVGFCRMCGTKIQIKSKEMEKKAEKVKGAIKEENGIIEKSKAIEKKTKKAMSIEESIAIIENAYDETLERVADACWGYVEYMGCEWDELEPIISCEFIDEKLQTICERIENEQVRQTLKRGYLELEDEDWVAASQCFEQGLSYDAECAELYWGQFLAYSKARNEKELAVNQSIDRDNKYVKRALRFATEEQKIRYQSILDAMSKKIIYITVLVLKIKKQMQESDGSDTGQKIVSSANLLRLLPESSWKEEGWESKKLVADLERIKDVVSDSLIHAGTYDVQLVSVGEDRLEVTREFSLIVGVNSYVAEDLFQTLPLIMKRDVSGEQAMEIKRQLEQAGAKVKLIKKEE